VQLADQVTPPGAISLLTTALKEAAVPAVMGFAAALTEIAMEGTIVMLADPVLVVSAIEVAVNVTGLVDGTDPGAA
jgi:hypothetical protein